MDPPNPVFAPFRVTRGQKRPREDCADAEGSVKVTETRVNRAKVKLGIDSFSYTSKDESEILEDTSRGKRKDRAKKSSVPKKNQAFNTRATKNNNKKTSSKGTTTTQPSAAPPNKYSALTLVAMRNIMKPYGVKGIGSMKKDELLQLCLLYNPEVPSSPPPPSKQSATKTTKSNGQTRLQLTREFHKSLDEEDRRSSSEEDQPRVRTRRHVLSLSSPEKDIESEEEMERLQSEACSSPPHSPPLVSAASKGKQKQTQEKEIYSDEEMEYLPSEVDLSSPRPPPVVSAASKGKQKQTAPQDETPPQFNFPSRERGTALPRPHPTNLSAVSEVSRKGKGKVSGCDDEDSDWEISGDEDLDDDDQDSENENEESSFSSQDHPRMEEDSIDSNTHDESEGPERRIERILGSQITQLNNIEANQDNSNSSDLRQQVQSLGQAVRELATLFQQNMTGSGAASSGKSARKSKRKSSADFLARIRSHVRKLMGLRENEEIPGSATRGQMSTWKQSTTRRALLSMSVNPNELSPQINNDGGYDPRFPYKGGPGGEFSNPQELLIMWTMMNRVGVSSFRPVWEEPIGSTTNSFLWRLAAAIFIQLVKCGQYDNIAPDDAKFDVVLAALKKHARQSLQRIVRERNEWPVTKIRASKKHAVRQQRVRGMKSRRKAIALRSGLPLLCNLIDQCCSDDESDFENEPSGSQKKIFRIKKLVWRSSALQTLILSLEAHRSKEKENSPKGTPGVRPTERVRDLSVLSEVQAPPGLPIDCYDADWLKNLEEDDPDQFELLQVDPTPMLRSLEVRAYEVLKIQKV